MSFFISPLNIYALLVKKHRNIADNLLRHIKITCRLLLYGNKNKISQFLADPPIVFVTDFLLKGLSISICFAYMKCKQNSSGNSVEIKIEIQYQKKYLIM